MMKHSSRQFGEKFSEFGHQREKFSRIGACIRRNYTPCISVNNILCWCSMYSNYVQTPDTCKDEALLLSMNFSFYCTSCLDIMVLLIAISVPLVGPVAVLIILLYFWLKQSNKQLNG